MENYTLLQFFEWYYPAEGGLWNQLKKETGRLKDMGIDAVWIPPAHKGIGGGEANGYDSYDLYDLGEFEQKGSVATKWGTKQQLIDAVKVAHDNGLRVYVDIVLNHMGGADENEVIMARKVNPDNRNESLSDPYEIEAATKFTFPGRQGKYSQFVWDYQCFSGIDYDFKTKETGVFKIQNEYGEGWQEVLSDEMGNYDYLMFADVDFRNPNVIEELKRWGKWFHETVKFDGFRLDAIKHMPPAFYNEWLDYMRGELKHEFFTVGEYWAPYDLPSMLKYIELTEGRMSLFDAPLQSHFHEASVAGKDYNLCTIFDETLVSTNPQLAVTLVENHDTQPLQSLEDTVEKWFRPLAYALILLREAGYPCVFFTDIYESHYVDKGNDGEEHEVVLEKVDELEALLGVRKNLAYGEQVDYFDHPNCIGWVRRGDEEHANSGCAVIISNSDAGTKSMEVGKQFAGKIFIDCLMHINDEVTINEDGWAEFKVNGGSVSVWVLKQ